MPTTMSFDQHLDAVARAAELLAERAAGAGTGAAVPTCPRWTVADLLAHVGIVHRWAAANLRGDTSPSPSKTAVLRQTPPDQLLDWFHTGADALLATFRETPDDVRAMVFLNDAPAPRDFWARRQAHETTVHAADALAAALGRAPTASEVGVGADLAADGVDELLHGFFTRGRSRIADGVPFTISVEPSDADRRWRIHVDGERLTTTSTPSAGTPPSGTSSGGAPSGDAASPTMEGGPADAVFAGTAAQLYLGLWNRGDEITATGRPDLLARWHQAQRVRWS